MGARPRLLDPARRDPASSPRPRTRLPEQRGDPSCVPRCDSRTSAPPGRRTSNPPRATASVAPTPTSASRGSQSRTSGASASISSGRTYGGFETTRSQGPAGSPVKRSHSRSSIATPVRSAFAPATSSASADASTPVTTAPGCSSASASAIAPLPSPRRERAVPRGLRCARGSARRRSRSPVEGRARADRRRV